MRTFSIWARVALLVLLGADSLISGAPADFRYILELTPGTDGVQLAAKYSLTPLHAWRDDTHWNYSVSSSQALTPTVLKNIRAERGVREVELDAELLSAESEPASRPKGGIEALGSWFPFSGNVNFHGAKVHSGYVNQPGIAIVRADEANAQFGLGWGVVAVIDTGVDTNHAALRDVLVPGYDFTRNRADTVSEINDLDPATASALEQSTVEILDGARHVVQLNSFTAAILSQSTVEILDGLGKGSKSLPAAFGHGTMVAGLIHRIAPTARIMPLKAFRSDGSAALSDISRAILYAVDNGASVISMSFGFNQPSPQLQAAVDYATNRGVLCIASAGNGGKETKMYPAAFPRVLGTGSTNYSDKRSSFSNYGVSARTAAPGEALLTTFPGNTYAGVWGTSFSAALISGSMTLFRQVSPGMRYGDASEALDYGVRIDQDMGDARLDLVRSIDYLLKRR